MAEAATTSGATGGPAGSRLAAWAVAAATAVLFAAMPAWRGEAPQPVRYAMPLPAFEAAVDAMVAGHTVRHDEASGLPVVRPPAGDVFVLARRWQFYPLLELEAGKTYRLHVASGDILHGFAMEGADLLLAPGFTYSVELKPDKAGQLVMQCSEYCGLDHSRMKAAVKILE